jgi:type I restriction enzyme S subunit
MPDEFVVPEGWTATTLGAIGNYLNGRAFKSSEWSTRGRPIIRIQDLTGSNRNPNHFEGELEERYVVRPGDFLISWSATLGAYIWDGPEAVLNQHIFKVESKIDRRFHYHLVRDRLAELQRNTHGSGMVHVTKGVFENTAVAVPDSTELQRALSDIIDRSNRLQTSAAEHVAAAQRAVVRFRKGVLAAACTGRLTADWRDENPEAASVATALEALRRSRRRKSRRTERPVDLVLPDLPGTYVVSTVGASAVVLEYGTSQRCDASSDNGAVPVLRMGNIQDGQLDLGELKYCRPDKEIDRLLLSDGDLVFNRTNSPELVGKSAVFHASDPMSFASYLIRVRFAPRVAHPDFVNYWINSAWGRDWAQLAKTDGVSQSNINGTKLSVMPLPLPPAAEQAVIVERASKMLGLADELLRRINRAGIQIERSSQAVLAKAFRGELVNGSGARL